MSENSETVRGRRRRRRRRGGRRFVVPRPAAPFAPSKKSKTTTVSTDLVCNDDDGSLEHDPLPEGDVARDG
jgi:hypothetical protein